MEQDFDIRAYLGVLRRRYMHFLIPALLLFVAALATAYLLPKSYHSQATILVESQQIPSDLARSTVTSAAAERIAIIRQRLITRSNLLQIVREFKLFPNEQENMSPTELVAAMRGATQIEPVNIGNQRRRDGTVIAFTVSFEYGNAATAARVANRFVQLILEQNIRSRTDRASETRKFFEQRVQDLEKDLTRQEAAIIKFKSENEEALPDSLAYRRTLVTDMRSRLPDIDQKILELEVQLELLRPDGSGKVTEDPSDPIDQEIEKLRLQLKQLETTYSQKHPAVKRVKGRLLALESGRITPNPNTKPDAEVPEAQVTAIETDAEARTLGEVRRDALEQQLTALKEQRSKQQGRIAALEETLQKTPQVEIELNVLNREYQALEDQLSQARAKMEEASVGERLEEDRQAERFEVIEQATAPDTPSKPNRPRIVLGGLFVSIAAGVGLVILFELLDQSIRTARDLQKSLQLRPIATIPLVHTAEDTKHKFKRRVLIAVVGMVAVCGAAVLTHMFYKPLDLVWLKLLQKIGI